MKRIMVMIQLEQLQGIHGEVRKDRPPPNHIRGMLVRHKDVFTNVLLKTWSRKKICSTRDWILELCGDKWTWWMDMKKVKAIQEEKWPLTQKGLRSLVGLANYYHRFIRDFSKVATILFNLLEKMAISKMGWTLSPSFWELKSKFSS